MELCFLTSGCTAEWRVFGFPCGSWLCWLLHDPGRNFFPFMLLQVLTFFWPSSEVLLTAVKAGDFDWSIIMLLLGLKLG